MTWLRPPDVSIGSLSMRLWSMSVCAVGSRSSRIFRVADDLHGGRRARQRQRQIERDRHAAAHVDVLFERLKSLRGHRDVIGVRRQVAEHILARGVRRRRPAVAGDRDCRSDLDRLHHAAGRVFDDALDGAGAAQPLGGGARHADRADRDRGLQNDRHCLEESSLRHPSTVLRAPDHRDRNRTSGLFLPATVSRTPSNGAWRFALQWKLLFGGSHHPLSGEDEPLDGFLFQCLGIET